MGAPLARLKLARLCRQVAIALAPEQALLEILTAALPGARAIDRIDRGRVVKALTIDVLGGDAFK